jgi:hypothetical protein
MKILLKHGEERMEITYNRGIKINNILQFTIDSYAIQWNTRSMTIHIN